MSRISWLCHITTGPVVLVAHSQGLIPKRVESGFVTDLACYRSVRWNHAPLLLNESGMGRLDSLAPNFLTVICKPDKKDLFLQLNIICKFQ